MVTGVQTCALPIYTAVTYVLADSSKLGVIAVHRVCALGQLTAVITDDEENLGASAALAVSVTLLHAAPSRQPSLTAAG